MSMALIQEIWGSLSRICESIVVRTRIEVKPMKKTVQVWSPLIVTVFSKSTPKADCSEFLAMV